MLGTTSYSASLSVSNIFTPLHPTLRWSLDQPLPVLSRILARFEFSSLLASFCQVTMMDPGNEFALVILSKSRN